MRKTKTLLLLILLFGSIHSILYGRNITTHFPTIKYENEDFFILGYYNNYRDDFTTGIISSMENINTVLVYDNKNFYPSQSTDSALQDARLGMRDEMEVYINKYTAQGLKVILDIQVTLDQIRRKTFIAECLGFSGDPEGYKDCIALKEADPAFEYNTERLEYLQWAVNNFEANNNVLGWYLLDEPEMKGEKYGYKTYKPDYLEPSYSFLKESSSKPVLIVDTKDGWKEGDNKIYQDNMENCDIIGYDRYPCFDNPEEHGYFPEEVAYIPNVIKHIANKDLNKPILMVVQAFGDNADNDKFRNPTNSELRYMFYSSIIHGARGTLFYRFHNEKQEMRDAVDDLCGVFTNHQFDKIISSSPMNYVQSDQHDSDAINYTLRKYGEHYYLFVVNDSDSDIDGFDFQFSFGIDEINEFDFNTNNFQSTGFAEKIDADIGKFEIKIYRIKEGSYIPPFRMESININRDNVNLVFPDDFSSENVLYKYYLNDVFKYSSSSLKTCNFSGLSACAAYTLRIDAIKNNVVVDRAYFSFTTKGSSSYPNYTDQYNYSSAIPGYFSVHPKAEYSINLKPGFSYVPSSAGKSFTAEIIWTNCDRTNMKQAQGELVNDSVLEGQESDNQVIVYPNPTNGYIHIVTQGMDEEVNIMVRDIYGKLIYTKQCYGEDKLDLSEIPKGLYFVLIRSSQINTVRTIIKN